MSEKSTPAADDAKRTAANRVRDNQRRARERHKAYFQDLQRKVSDYEKNGVQATLEMQQAARSVAIENEQLRVLLRRKGVGDDEITAFLRSPDTTCDGSGQGTRKLVNGSSVTKSQGLRSGHSTTTSGPVQPLPVDFTNFQPDGLAILADVSAQQKCCNGQTICADVENDQSQALEDFLPTAATATTGLPASTQTSHPNNLSSSTTMSCLAAAKIVADLQGHGDSERARASLGCCDEGECTVKNTAVFQVMDRG